MRLIPILLLAFPPSLPATAQYRTVYPYSVLPGGIAGTNLDQVQDPVARQAWDGVKALSAACLRPGRYYLQYRKGDQVGWTKEPRLIKAGEPVMVDQASHILRVRCGNGISKTPRLPLVPFVPPTPGDDDEQLIEWSDPPQLSPAPPWTPGLVDLPPDPVSKLPFVPFTPIPSPTPPLIGPVPFDPLDPAPVVTPEPGMWLLLGLGLVLLVLAKH